MNHQTPTFPDDVPPGAPPDSRPTQEEHGTKNLWMGTAGMVVSAAQVRGGAADGWVDGEGWLRRSSLAMSMVVLTNQPITIMIYGKTPPVLG